MWCCRVAGARPRDGRPPLPAATAAVGQARDTTTGANEDEPEISEAAKNLLKQQVQSLSAKVEEVSSPFIASFTDCLLPQTWLLWLAKMDPNLAFKSHF